MWVWISTVGIVAVSGLGVLEFLTGLSVADGECWIEVVPGVVVSCVF